MAHEPTIPELLLEIIQRQAEMGQMLEGQDAISTELKEQLDEIEGKLDDLLTTDWDTPE